MALQILFNSNVIRPNQYEKWSQTTGVIFQHHLEDHGEQNKLVVGG